MVKKINNIITIEELQEQVKILTIKVQKLEKNIKNNNKIKKTKDPNAPKKNVNAFFHYNNEKRENFKKNNPDVKVYITNITKEAKGDWDKLTETQKKKYEDLAKNDEKRYERELKKYNEFNV